MESTVKTTSTKTPTSAPLSSLIKSLGPGIMMAAAAVGGSHLVASTKAGAIYGWQLAALIILVNIFKYPFFKAGIQYTLGTGQSLVEGYSNLGRPYLVIFSILSAISAVVNTAALLLFSASLLSYFIPFDLATSTLCMIVLATCLIILFAGHYRALDTLSKAIMAILTITTLAAVAIAIGSPVEPDAAFVPPSPWSLAAIGFIVVTMGWMPAPIEISSITSMWLKSQKEKQDVTAQSALFDFNVGYIGTALLALVFVALGALVLHGSGVELSRSGVGFTHQLVGIYASTIGEWSRPLIAIVAFFCIFGSTITVIDGYSRVLAESQRLLLKKESSPRMLQGWIIIVSIAALAIVMFFSAALMPMLDFAMILAFITVRLVEMVDVISSPNY